MFMRWEIINTLIEKNNYKSYLEIGQQKGQNFREIIIDHKVGVDPKPKDTLGVPCKYKMTSDEFFNFAVEKKLKFDIVFIDGLHISEQVIKDVNNSLKLLNSNGSIVLHDCKPESEFEQITSSDTLERKDRRLARGKNQGKWTGDVWEAFLHFRMSRDDLTMLTVDTDCGCGIIQKGSQDLYVPNKDELSWQYFSENKKQILNLISVSKFKELYK